MTPQSKLETLFHRAAEIQDANARRAFLATACEGDELLRRQLEALLEHDAPSSDFLTSPALSNQPATSDHTSARIDVGGQVGPYRLMEQIGEGGFGLVFVAEQQQPVRRKVALKIIKPGMDSRDVIARFEAERQALALMDHPHIAKVFDAGTTAAGTPYFVMELVRGIPITDYCDQNQLGLRERLELFIAVCRAVQHAHQKGIIHRDIKPSNVLVTLHDGKPIVKVIDFGIAKALHQRLTEKTIYTRFAQMIGTPLYMSPEQAEMSGLDVDTRSDIYSLGVLLYELLTGATPFDRRRLAEAAFDELRRIIREEEPPKPSTRVSKNTESLPTVAAQRRTEPKKLSQLFKGDLDWIVMKALEKDRTRRYETASAFASDVARYLSDEPVEATPPTSTYLFRKWVKKQRVKLIISSICASALLVGVLGLVWGMVTANESARIARLDRDKAQMAERAAKENEEKAKASERRAKAEEAKAKASAEEADTLLRTIGKLAEDAYGKVKDGENWRNRTFEEAVAIAEGESSSSFKDQPMAEARFRNFLGQFYESRGDIEKLIVQRRLAYDLAKRAEGPGSPATTGYAQNLANAYYYNDEKAKAIATYREAIEEATKALGATNVLVEDLEIYSSLLASTPEEIKQVIATLQKIRSRAKKEHGEMSQRYALPSWYLAGALARQKDYQAAAQVYEELQSLFPDGKVENGLMEIPDLAAQAAGCYRANKQFDKAIAIYERIIAERKTKLGAGHPDLVEYLRMLYTLYTEEKNLFEAESKLREILQSLITSKEADPAEIAKVKFNLGKLLIELEKPDEAETTLRGALPAEGQDFGALHEEINLTLGSLLVSLEKHADAEPLLQSAYKHFSEFGLHFEMTSDGNAKPRDPQPHIQAADGLVAVYEALNKPEDLAKWKKIRAAHPKNANSPSEKPENAEGKR